MIKLSHDTHKSCPDENFNCHRVCIDVFSSKRSKNYMTYTAKRYTFARNKYSDDRHDMTCTAKFPSSKQGTKKWALGERARAEIVRASAVSFNKLMNTDGPRLVFTLPQYACLESVASLSKRRVGEYVTFEDTLLNFLHFVDINGREVKHTSRRSFRRKSSRRKNSHCTDDEVDACCYHKQQSFELAPSELADPALDMNYLVPTSPPCEDDNPPSYDEIFGPYMNANDHSRTDVGNDMYNFNCMNYFPVESGVSGNQQTHVDTSSCTQYNRNNVSCGVVQTATDFSSRTHDQSDNLPHPVLRAFIHVDFYEAKGQRVVSNLKGTCDHGDKYTLTTPTFHSLTRNYGERDKGEAGLLCVIENHVCSRWCRHLPSMHDIYLEALKRTSPK